MENERRNPENDKITLEIARKLASEGKYNDAFQLLRPLLRSQYAVEASVIIAKMYAQNQDFSTAERYYLHALKMDGHNPEALRGLNKCRELKDSSLRTFLSFNKLNIVAAAVVILFALLLAVAFHAII